MTLAGIIAGSGYTAPECGYTLRADAVYSENLPDAPKKRIYDLFRATITHKNQFSINCFNFSFERWNNFFLSKGAKEILLYGSSTRQVLDKYKEFSQEYINEPLEIREDKSADMDCLVLMPGANKSERAKVLDEVLKLAVQEMYPNGNAPDNEIHKLRRTLFVNLSNKDGKGRYAHLKFLIFSLNSSICLNGRDIPLKIDFVISGNHYPLLFNIDQFCISVPKFLNGERFSPCLKSGLQDILQLSRRRLIPNPEINYDELSFIKRLNRSLQGFYLPFSEDEKFVQVVLDPSLHRKSKKLTSAERQTIELEKSQSNLTDAQVKAFIKRLKKRLSFEDIQAKAFQKYFNCSISLTVFAFQLRMMFKKDLIKLQKLVPVINPSNWQERLINWMQNQLYNPAFLDKIPSLCFLLLVKMISGENNIRIYEDALRIRFQIQKVTVFLFLPLDKLEVSSYYLNEIKEVLNIGNVQEALDAFFYSQMILTDQKSFQQLFELIQKEAPSLLRTTKGAIWILRAFQIGWISKETALKYAHDSDDYFNALEQDASGFGRCYLQKFPNAARAMAYYTDRPFQIDELRKSVPREQDLDAIVLKSKWNYEEILQRLRSQRDFFLKFGPDYCRQIIEELVFRRGMFDLTDFISYYLGEFRDETQKRLAIICEPEAYLADLERVIDFVNSYPFPVPASIIRYTISLILSTVDKSKQIEALHRLYLQFGGKRGEEVPYMRVFDDMANDPPTLYKISSDDKDYFYVRYYNEVCLQLLPRIRPLADYDYIINQLMLILPDLSVDEVEELVKKWLQVRHENKEALINHFTTSLARLINYMAKTISPNKRLKRLQDKMAIIAGMHDPKKKCPMELFREAVDGFDLDNPSTLEQALFIISNAPINIRENLSIEYCNHLFEKSFRGVKDFDSRSTILESLVYVLIGVPEAMNNSFIFHSSKKILIEKMLTLYSFVIEFCSKDEVDKESLNIFISGVRIMQVLKDNHILELDGDHQYREKAEEFIMESPKYIQSPYCQFDLRGAMNHVYMGSSLQNKFIYETATFMQRYCTLT